jgi:cytochrome bd ubiquinol oxidase subunit II
MLAAAWWSFGRADHDNLTFVATALAVVVGIGGLAVILYPHIVPPSLTIARAASPTSSLDFLLGGMGTFVPLVIAYNAYAFWVLRPRRASGALSQAAGS